MFLHGKAGVVRREVCLRSSRLGESRFFWYERRIFTTIVGKTATAIRKLNFQVFFCGLALRVLFLLGSFPSLSIQRRIARSHVTPLRGRHGRTTWSSLKSPGVRVNALAFHPAAAYRDGYVGMMALVVLEGQIVEGLHNLMVAPAGVPPIRGWLVRSNTLAG